MSAFKDLVEDLINAERIIWNDRENRLREENAKLRTALLWARDRLKCIDSEDSLIELSVISDALGEYNEKMDGGY